MNKYATRTTETVKDRVFYPADILNQLRIVQGFYSAGELPFDAVDILFIMVSAVARDPDQFDQDAKELRVKCQRGTISPKDYILKSYLLSVRTLKNAGMLVRTETNIEVTEGG